MPRKLSIGQAWADASAFLRRERRILAPLVLGLIAVPAVVMDMVQPRVPQGELPPLGPLWVVIVGMGLTMLVGQMAIALLAGGWSNTAGGAIRRAVRRLPTLIGAGLLVLLPVIALVLSIGAIGGFQKAGAMPSIGAGLAGVVLLIVLILVGVIIFIGMRTLPLFVVVASGEEGPIAALRHSFRLTRGNFWKIVAFTLLITVAFVVLAAAVSAVVGAGATLLLGSPDPWTVSRLLIALVGGLLQAGFVSIYTAMIASMTVQLEGGAISGS